jgi:hypothetical protein
MHAAFAARGQLQEPQAANVQQAAAGNSKGFQPHLPLQQESVSAAAGQDACGRDSAGVINLASIAQMSEDCIVGLSVSASGTSKAAAAKAQPHEAETHRHGQAPECKTDHADVPANSPGRLCQQQQQQQQHFAACSVATKQSAAPRPAAAVAAAAPAAVQSDTYGLNVLLSRVAFELLQSSEFEGRLEGALQQWLDGIRRPAYLDR